MLLSRIHQSIAFVAALVGSTAPAVAGFEPVGAQPNGRYLLPTGKALTPVGTHIEVNDRPLGMATSPDGRHLAVVTGSNFAPKALHVIELQTGKMKQTFSIGDSFVGVAFSPQGDKIFVGGARNNDVKLFALGADGLFAASGTIAIAASSPSGLSISADGRRLYVALNLAQSVAVIDTTTQAVLAKVPVGIYPYTTLLSRDGSKLYVSNWGGRVPGAADFTDGMFPVVVDPRTGIPSTGTISVVDTSSNATVKTINVGLHPCAMAMSPDGRTLYVANANSDSVSVIDTASDSVTRSLNVGPVAPGGKPLLGSSPNAIAVSPDGRTLYVANASENAIAVIDTMEKGHNPVQGLIPTGW